MIRGHGLGIYPPGSPLFLSAGDRRTGGWWQPHLLELEHTPRPIAKRTTSVIQGQRKTLIEFRSWQSEIHWKVAKRSTARCTWSGRQEVVYSERKGWLAAGAVGGLPVGLIYNTGTRDYFPVQEEWIQCLVGQGSNQLSRPPQHPGFLRRHREATRILAEGLPSVGGCVGWLRLGSEGCCLYFAGGGFDCHARPGGGI